MAIDIDRIDDFRGPGCVPLGVHSVAIREKEGALSKKHEIDAPGGSFGACKSKKGRGMGGNVTFPR